MKKKVLMRRFFIAGLTLVIIALVALFFSKPLYRILATYGVRKLLTNSTRYFEDGLHGYLAGSGSPFPDLKRAGPCIAVVAGNHLYIVDAGEGSAKNIILGGFQIGRADAILLTHFHSDHIADLGEMMFKRWVSGSNARPNRVIGPRRVEQVVEGFNIAYKLDTGYRVAHHGPAVLPPTGAGGTAIPFDLGPEPEASVKIVDEDGVSITAFKVDHRPVVPAVGYRFDYKGRSLVISGDTVYSPSLLEHSRGADLLFHEALNREMVQLIHDNAELSTVPALKEYTHDIQDYHSSPEEAAKIANLAGVRQLIFYHLIPPLPDALARYMFLGDARSYYKGPIAIGHDGMLISMPADSDRIIFKKALK